MDKSCSSCEVNCGPHPSQVCLRARVTIQVQSDFSAPATLWWRETRPSQTPLPVGQSDAIIAALSLTLMIFSPFSTSLTYCLIFALFPFIGGQALGSSLKGGTGR